MKQFALTKKRKLIILGGMVALLIVTAVLNIWLLGGDGDDPEYLNTAGFFTSYRLERETTRAQEILYLDSIINNESAEFAAAKATAMQQKLKLISVMETELLLESLIKAKGFDDAVVSIGAGSDNINVIVMCDELTLNDTILIYNVIKDEMGSADLVKIFNI
jgi:stage III sporulation protein AH